MLPYGRGGRAQNTRIAEGPSSAEQGEGGWSYRGEEAYLHTPTAADPNIEIRTPHLKIQ